MSTIVGCFRKNIIDLLNLHIEDGTPIYIGEINRNHILSSCNAEKYIEKGTLVRIDKK